MITYKLVLDPYTKNECAVISSEGWCIPFAPDNTDYQKFKIDIANGVALQDADGKPITDVTQFMKGLP